MCRERQDTRDPLTSRDDPGIGGEDCNRENRRSSEKRHGGSSRVEHRESTEEERPDNGAQTYEGGSHLLPRFYGVPYRIAQAPRKRRPKAGRNQVTEFGALLNIDRGEIVATFDRIAGAKRSLYGAAAKRSL